MISNLVYDTKRSLVISDIIAWITACFVILLSARFLLSWPSFPGRALIVFPGFLALWVISLAVTGCYQPATWQHTATRLLFGAVLAAAVGIAVGEGPVHLLNEVELLLIAALALGLTIMFRVWLPWRIRRQVLGKECDVVLVLGESALAASVASQLQEGLHLKTIRSVFPQGPDSENKLAKLIAHSKAKEVLWVPTDSAPPSIEQSLEELCRQHHVGWQFVGCQERLDKRGFEAVCLGRIPILHSKSSSITGFNLLYKMLLDLGLGSILFLCAAPVMILIAIAVRLTSSGPAVLEQERVGHLGTPFKMYKFRTMYDNVNDEPHREYIQDWIKNHAHGESNGQKIFKIMNDDRITPLGRLLRRYSLDELPQFLNVLKREMSLVGPRPAMPYEVEYYLPWHLERLDGPPGLTGPWQTNGRNHLSFDEMVQLDIGYLHNWSPVRDLVLIARTLPAMLNGKGH